MRYLRPFILYERYYSPIEREIQRAFDEILYRKLFEIVGIGEFHNSMNALLDAIRNGGIWYENGEFKGSFSAKITVELRKIGAEYKPATRTWKLKELPTDVKFAQAEADDVARSMRQKIISVLDDITPDQLDLFYHIKSKYEHTLDAMEHDFESAVAAISIKPVLNEYQKTILSTEYTTNLDLYIKGWLEDTIPKLREEVQEHAFKGGRAESLSRVIMDSYGTSQNKAKFLARQETSLLMSKFKESRYTDIGITKYKWSGADDFRERPDHKALNGKIFRFDTPPITDRKTGARNNPGEDFNCRCQAIPIVE